MTALLLEAAGWCCLIYLAAVNLGYLALSVVSFVVLGRYADRYAFDATPMHPEFEPPVTVIVPAFNEALTVVATVRSLLQLRYGRFEIVVINDGSTDATLRVLTEAFNLKPFPEAPHVRIATRLVRGVYRAPAHPELRVIDKENGGKADALNAGINAARCPLFCALDADGILQPDSLSHVVRPFLEDPRTVATGGVIRVANGCRVVSGWLVEAGLPRNPLALVQVVEYCRAFLFGRLGWNPLNAVLVISGAFGVFHKQTVIAAGGYRTGVAGEDMELVVRLHRLLRDSGTAYRITFVPDPVCWTEVPERLRVLRRQRIRWQRGLCESLSLNAGLCRPRGGAAAWLAFPFALVVECLSPLVEALGYVVIAAGYVAGSIDLVFALWFCVATTGLGILVSASALLLDEASFHSYPKARHIRGLLLAAIGENFGYRQLTVIWRLEGLLGWAVRLRQTWGEMTRSASWATEISSVPTTGERHP